MDFPSGALGRGDEMTVAQPVPGAGASALDPLRSLLHSVSSGLSASELSAIKFLCRDKIGKGRLDKVENGLGLFDILIEHQEITKDNLELLKELLQRIRRRDLLSQVVQFEEGEPHGPDDQTGLLKAAFAVICDNVGREWKRLMRQLGMPEVKLDRIEEAYPRKLYEQLYQALREWQKWKGKDAKVTDLITALRGCKLNFVADKVEEKISQLNTGTR